MSHDTITGFDSFVNELKRMPDSSGELPIFAVNDPLEQHFFDVADKHGIIDHMCFNEDAFNEEP